MDGPPTNPRKQKTEAELKALGIPLNVWLPVIDPEEEATIRDPKDVASRAVVLYAVTCVGNGDDRKAIRRGLDVHRLWESVSPREQILFAEEDPPRQEILNVSWRAEALWVLLWALGKCERLDLPKQMCDTVHIQGVLSNKDAINALIDCATLRPISEILDETDKIYRIHWAVRDAQLHGRPIPLDLNPEIVDEWHYSLNWLTFYADEWDEVTTDT